MIASQTTYQQQEREILPDDIRREAKRSKVPTCKDPPRRI